MGWTSNHSGSNLESGTTRGGRSVRVPPFAPFLPNRFGRFDTFALQPVQHCLPYSSHLGRMIPQRPVLRLPNGFDFGRISRPPFATPLIPGQNSSDRKKLTLRSCCLYTFKVITLKKAFPIKKGSLHAMAVDYKLLKQN